MSTLSQFFGGIITGYTQSGVITSSGSVAIPAGTKRIEVLLCGGGGAGGSYVNGAGGGGFGGAQIYVIPAAGSTMDYVIGAGGVAGANGSPGGRGGTTSVSINGTIYAAVGGGGGGNTNIASNLSHGLYGGAGGGAQSGQICGNGGAPFSSSTLLWSAMDSQPRSMNYYITNSAFVYNGLGGGANSVSTGPTYGRYGEAGWGPGGGGDGYGSGGGGVGTSPAGWGSGHAYNNNSGYNTLAGITIWGYTGYTGGTTSASGGSGGGGLFGQGGNGSSTGGGVGGLGGGGGGGFYGSTYQAGAGGAGALVYRFYY